MFCRFLIAVCMCVALGGTSDLKECLFLQWLLYLTARCMCVCVCVCECVALEGTSSLKRMFVFQWFRFLTAMSPPATACE